MFARDWQSVSGTVIEQQYHRGNYVSTGPETSPSCTYVVEARLPDGDLVQQELGDVIGTRQISIAVGASVPLLVHGKHHTLKWDGDDALLKAARGIGVTTAERHASGYLDDEQWATAVRALRGQPNPRTDAEATQIPTGSAAPGADIADKLAKLVQLERQGYLSAAQFERAKQELLGG